MNARKASKHAAKGDEMEHQATERLPPKDLSANDSPRKAIQSVEIGVRVLRALMDCPRDGAHLREVAEKSGLSRSQAHRYLLSFVNTGVVEQQVGVAVAVDVGGGKLGDLAGE